MNHRYEEIRGNHGPRRRQEIHGSSGALRRWVVGLTAILIAAPCAAHHSMAMFDQSKSLTLQGTVKELQWTNPHCFLQVLVTAEPTMPEWSVEMLSPAAMYRAGWRPRSLRPGDKVTVVIHPLKDGTIGGLLVSATAADGKVMITGKPRT
jgi:hypothetical protein